MSILTTFFNLIKPAKTDGVKVQDFNDNMDIIDAEMHKPPLTINGIEPDPVTRNTYVETVPLADNLTSDIAQINYGDFIERTSGGDSSIEDGDASLVTIKGNYIHTGYVPQSVEMTVTATGDEPITATIDEATFISEMTSASGTLTLTYTSDWSADPAGYGITVTGTPVEGDEITVAYTKEDPGTITVATPTAFNSTGWNLYDSVTGIAKVVAYSTQYGYKLGGTYSLVEFSTSAAGTNKTAVTVTDGYFNVTENGYIFITGGDATTYIYPTWSDWIDSYDGNFQAYDVVTISLSEVMLLFPYGLCAVGDVRDEINANAQRAIQRVERLANTAENMASVIESGVAYVYDTNYIYAVLDTPVVTSISLDTTYSVSDHGLEYFSGTTVPVYTEILYGENLKDKLRTDVLTISAQTLDSTQKAQVRSNIGAPPTSHAANATTYGAGNASNYGHVKLSDTYSGTASTSAKAANSIGASQWALQTAYNNAITKASSFAAGDTYNFQSAFFGKSNNDKTAFFGCITLPKNVTNLRATLSSAGQSGYWYSDGASHTLTLTGLTSNDSATNGNSVWFAIPATGITATSTVCYLRLYGNLTFAART